MERSGRVRTLVEMIEGKEGDDDSRMRLVKLLLGCWPGSRPTRRPPERRSHAIET